MDEFIDELKQQVTFKETTAVGDIVLLASDDPRMVIYALVTGIEPDPGRKSWWNITMQVLTFPPQEAVWTLREPQFTGQESFTFSGLSHFMKAVSFDTVQPLSPEKAEVKKKSSSSIHRLRVVK